MKKLFVGLMSGTSMDGIDAVVVGFENGLEVLAADSFAFPASLQQELNAAVIRAADLTTIELCRLDHKIGKAFAAATVDVIKKARVDSSSIQAVGSHGQTIFHSPDSDPPFTLQLGDPNVIARMSGLPVVADFRRMDMTLGGQGAPLAPGLHDYLFRSDKTDRVVANIGGIANITVLPSNGTVMGFDTGPGNTLMDAWIRHCREEPYDAKGKWALTGQCDPTLLGTLKADGYFSQSVPKSTGPEYFNLDWLYKTLGPVDAKQEDIQRLLLQLTAETLCDAIDTHAPKTREIYVCGGGSKNNALMEVLSRLSPTRTVQTTEALGLHPDWVEAVAFAWLAQQRLAKKP
ncbi:MAG: anhydro-N-acetylmuramic acid kinase, partial [Pseudomonadota bacterium]